MSQTLQFAEPFYYAELICVLFLFNNLKDLLLCVRRTPTFLNLRLIQDFPIEGGEAITRAVEGYSENKQKEIFAMNHHFDKTILHNT